MFSSRNKVASSSKKRLYQVLTNVGQPQIPAVKPWPQRKRAESLSQVESCIKNVVEFEFCNIAKSCYLFTGWEPNFRDIMTFMIFKGWRPRISLRPSSRPVLQEGVHPAFTT